MFHNVLTELNYADLWPLQRYRDSYFNEVDRLLVRIQISESMLRDSLWSPEREAERRRREAEQRNSRHSARLNLDSLSIENLSAATLKL